MPIDKLKYLAKHGAQCPYCFSDNICSANVDADGPRARAEVECNNCFKTWFDIFTLSDVEECDE